MRPRFLYALILAIGFAIGGFIVVFIQNHCLISLDPKISFGELVNAFSTILAAVAITVFLTYYIEKHSQTDRKEKELLLNQLDFILRLTQEFEKCNETGLYTDVVASHKRLSVTNAAFYKILKEFEYPTEVLLESNFEELIREINKLATETPVRNIQNATKRSNLSTTIKAGIISLAADKKALLDVKINDLKAKILRAQLVINRK